MQTRVWISALAAAAVLLPVGCSRGTAPGSWVLIETGTGDAFSSVNFVNERVGWLNGQTDRELESPEGEPDPAGKAPEAVPGKKKEDPLKANQGFEVLKTTDGGESWSQIVDLFKHKIRSVWFVDTEIGWAITIDPDILHTTDGGASWTAQRKAGKVRIKLTGDLRDPFMEQPEQIEGLYFVDALNGWAWGGGRMDDYAEQPGTFLTTVNGGADWNEIPFPFQHRVWSIFFLDRQHAWASTEDGAFYRTSDGGLNWAAIPTKRPEAVFRSIFFVDPNEGWVVGRSGRIAKTTDGGQTWKKMWQIKDQFVMRDIFFTDRRNGWAVGDQGAILYTPDGGDSWVNASPLLSVQLGDVQFVRGKGWAVGLSGAVLRYDSNPPVLAVASSLLRLSGGRGLALTVDSGDGGHPGGGLTNLTVDTP